MTHTGASTRDGRPPVPDEFTEAPGWTGWMWFASFVLTMIGIAQLLQGFMALLQPHYYAVDDRHLLVHADYTVWGWLHLGLAVLAFAVTAGLYSARPWARVTGIALASVSAVVQLAFIAAYPWWASLVIALDVLVIYAIVVHGHEMREGSQTSAAGTRAA